MGQIKWYKRDPSAALNGMMELDLQERGAYNTVLDLIYSRDGNLPDDDRFIAGWLRVDVRVWKRIKTTLIERGKLFLADGKIRNERADVEVLEALSRVASAQDAGRASARSKASKRSGVSKENSDLASTAVPTGVSTTVSTNHNHNHNIEEEPNGSPSSGASATQKTKSKSKRTIGVDHLLPSDWVPILTPDAERMVTCWPPGMFEREIANFRDHAATHGRLAKDWQAAFRTWLRKSDERRSYNGNRTFPDQPRDTRDAFQRSLDADLEHYAAERAARETGRPDDHGADGFLQLPMPEG